MYVQFCSFRSKLSIIKNRVVSWILDLLNEYKKDCRYFRNDPILINLNFN